MVKPAIQRKTAPNPELQSERIAACVLVQCARIELYRGKLLVCTHVSLEGLRLNPVFIVCDLFVEQGLRIPVLFKCFRFDVRVL